MSKGPFKRYKTLEEIREAIARSRVKRRLKAAFCKKRPAKVRIEDECVPVPRKAKP